MTTMQGVIHGKTIELEKEPGLLDGQTVTVTIERIEQPSAAQKPEDMPWVELWMDRLVFDSKVLPDERIVRGTRLSAEALVAELEQGRSDEEMLQVHPELSKEDMKALRYYARVPVGLRLTFGAWAGDAEELDQFLAELRRLRKMPRRGIEE